MYITSKKPVTLSHYEVLVLKAIRTIAAALDQALDLEVLASPACMAPLHFHRVFRGLTGETPIQMHRRLRLERAAWRLAEDDDPVLRIALDAGYETHEAFTRTFRGAFGRSPTEYRMLARPGERKQIAGEAGVHKPSHRLQAACGVHVDGSAILVPNDLFTHQGALAMDVQLEARPEIRVAAVAHDGPYNTIGSAFDRLGALAGPAGMFAVPKAQMIAIYYDDPETTPAEALRSAAGVTLALDAALPPALREIRLPAGRWARAMHRGSYGRLGDAWQRLLGQWLPNSGLRMGSGECYELYLNHPGNAREEDLETLLYVPIES